MRQKDRSSINLFIGVLLGITTLLLVALPSLSSAAAESTSNSSGIYLSIGIPGTFQATGTPQSTQTPTSQITLIPVITDTQVITPTFTPTPTLTPTATSTPQFSYLPYLYREHFNPTPPPPKTVLFCDSLSQSLDIPDNDPNGVNDVISINDGRYLASLSLYVDISHTWVGDVVVKLTHQEAAKTITVLSRPGPGTTGCPYDDIVTVLDDAAAQSVDDKCATYPHAISGIYLPDQALSGIASDGISGSWRLNVSDRYPNDTGALNHWCLAAKLSDLMPIPTPTPTPVSLPSSASVGYMSGQDQQLELDCESRSAVDWARHFGYNIGELDFLNHLPTSDDPDAGFVGDPDGIWGRMPPNDYGVHAPPVASLLQQYGLTANSFRSLSWDDLRAEIASGNPVIVWIIGGSSYNLVNGTPHFYTSLSTGNTTIVAPWEHTVIVTGYSSSNVTILNGSKTVTVPLDQFLDSWSVLDFMAVLARP